jgi:hypothetical protein
MPGTAKSRPPGSVAVADNKPMKAFSIFIVSMLAFSAPASAATPTQLLSEIPVSVDQPMQGYDRALFRHWVDADRDGCDTRREVLQAESLRRPKPACNNTITGRWYSPYDGRYHTRSRGMDIDHVVALAEAWRSGARQWDSNTRERFANDLYGPSLIAVTASVNRSKGDKDPSQWMVPRAVYRCQYLNQWILVKWRWRLTMNEAERNNIRTRLRACPRVNLTRPQRPPVGVVSAEPPATTGDDPRFDTCAEANAAGYGPYTQGVDPEYEWYRDGDGDGVVCEQ